MAAFCAAVIRGARKPLAVELTSSMADVAGAEPSELIPTLWAVATVANARNAAAKKMVRMVFILFGFIDNRWESR